MAFRTKGVLRISADGDANFGITTATSFDGKVSKKAITEQTDGQASDMTTDADELLVYDQNTDDLIRVTIDEFIEGSGIATSSALDPAGYYAVAGIDAGITTVTSIDVDGSAGVDNTFIGSSGTVDAGGTFGTLIGAGVGTVNTGNYNTFIGSGSGAKNTTGFENVSLGALAGQGSTDGSRNVHLGTNAGRDSNSGSDKTYIGHSAGIDLVGNSNVILGSSAASNTSSNGSFNVVLGTLAAQSLTFSQSVVIGQQAAQNNAGSNSVIVGALAGAGSLSGSNSTLIGHSAGSNVTGDSCTVLGASAGTTISGNFNTVLGQGSGTNITGTNNVVLGVQALNSGTALSGTGNVVLGTIAGTSLNSTSSRNILIGQQAGDGLSVGSDNVIIGSSSDIGNSLTSNPSTIIGANNITPGGVDSQWVLLGNSLTPTGTERMAIGLGANRWISGDSSYNVNVNAISADGDITANSDIVGDSATNISGINSVTASTYYGDGSNLTGVSGGVDGTHIEPSSITSVGVVTASQLDISGAAAIDGDTTMGGNLTGPGGLSALSNFFTISGSFLQGDGSGLTNVSADVDGDHIEPASINSTGIATAAFFYGDGSNLTNVNAVADVDGTHIEPSSMNTTGIVTASSFDGDITNPTISNTTSAGGSLNFSTTLAFGVLDGTILQTSGQVRFGSTYPAADASSDLGGFNAASDVLANRFWRDLYLSRNAYVGDGIVFGTVSSDVKWTTGSGTPEGSVSAPVGSMYTRTDGGTGTTLYVKESGTGNTGWVAK